MANLIINSLTVPTNIKQGTALAIALSVTAQQEDFDEGEAYNLLLFVNGLSAGLLGGAPLVKKGTLQDATFNATSVIVNFTVNAGSSPDVYTITALALGGPSGAIFETISSAGPVVVHA